MNVTATMSKRHYQKELINSLNERCLDRIIDCLDKGADINFPLNFLGFTPLHLAIIQNDLDIIKVLLRRGADIHSTTDKKETVLHLAVDNDRPAKVKANKKDQRYVERNEDVIKFLLSQPVNIDAKDVAGQSALHVAVKSSNTRLIELLLGAGINVNGTMKNGLTALLCLTAKHVENDARISMAGLLLDFGADVDAKNNQGETALYLAVTLGFFEFANYLISRKADVNCKTKHLLTPMFAAVQHCDIKMIEHLLANGAKIDVKNQWGDNPLHFAIKKTKDFDVKDDRYEVLLKLFIKHGLSLNAVNGNGMTPLHLTLENNYYSGYISCVRLVILQQLLNLGADVNQESARGRLLLAEIRPYLTYYNPAACMLLQHIALMTLNQRPISRKNLESITKNSEHAKYFNECLTEMKHMQSTLIDGKITYYDVFIKRGNELARCLKNPKVTDVLKAEKHKDAYRILWCELIWNVWKGKKRLDSITRAQAKLAMVIPIKLPIELLGIICENLSNVDLRNLEMTEPVPKSTVERAAGETTNLRKKKKC